MDIVRSNFEEALPQIEKAIGQSEFIGMFILSMY